MSDRNVAEFHSGAGRNYRILRFRKGNTPLGNGESKEERLRDARQFQQRKSSINGEEIFVRFVVLFSFERTAVF